MCEIVNCEINMMYITWNNVASVWECQKWRLKTNLFWETSKISMLFSPVSHCGTLYSKSLIQCTRPNTALWAPAARQLWSDGFRRLINRFGCASSMLWSWWFTDSGSFFLVKFRSISRVLVAWILQAKYQLCNTAGAAFLRRLICAFLKCEIDSRLF